MTNPAQHNTVDPVVIIGCGPAGASCAIWLAQLGQPCVIIERETQPFALLRSLDFNQNWVLGSRDVSTGVLATNYSDHLAHTPGIEVICSTQVREFVSPLDSQKVLVLENGRTIRSRAIVFATGLKPRHPVQFFSITGANKPLDATTLTRTRSQLHGKRILILGGGDNAVENAIFLAERGNEVLLCSRSELRAGKQFRDKAAQTERLHCRVAHPIPDVSWNPLTSHWEVQTDASKLAISFDVLCVMFGFEPDDSAWKRLLASSDSRKKGVPDIPLAEAERLSGSGIFLAGDVSDRLHPCISSAIADGVQAARKVDSWLNQPEKAVATDGEAKVSGRKKGPQKLEISGLRFAANLGILDHEKTAPQPIQVDAELNLGFQPLMPADDEIMHVLDYRKVRQIIINECTAEHVNLLESLIGKLCQRLMQLPGVAGVRVKITKLEIFEDCQVSINMEAGSWQ